MSAMRQLVLPSIAVAFVVLTACSSGQSGQHVASLASGGNTRTSTTTDPATAQHLYYQCLQQQGIKIAEPQGPNGNSSAGLSGLDPSVDPNLLNKAMLKCRQYLPNGGALPTVGPQEMASLLKQARCLRAHGVNVADPTPGAGLGTLAAPQGVTPQQFTAALQACSQNQ